MFEIQSSDKDKPYVGIDCVRCRKSGLAFNEFDFPVFRPYDSIRRATPGELADFSFINVKSRKSPFNTLPAINGSCW